MRYSKLLIPTQKQNPADAQIQSHILMLRAGMVKRVAAGIYTYLPLGWKVLQKISNIIREELNRDNSLEIMMPCVQPALLWQESGRWDDYGPELLRFKDRKNAEFCFGPTHEEIISDLVKNTVKSYKQLPLSLYQIQTKFRDEIRPRFGMMRAREFIMKDAYSFDISQAKAMESYHKMYDAYHRIFKRCGLDFRAVEAATGSIGGNKSHEFQVLAGTGEDTLVTCEKCDYSSNVELIQNSDLCPKCNSKMMQYKGIEVGHIFYLGTKYSKSMNVTVLSEQGKQQYIEMGCYGIGIGRVASAAIEQNHDDRGIIWPAAIAPYKVEIVSMGKGEAVKKYCDNLHEQLEQNSIDTLYDDRNERPGVKLADSDLLGCPIRIVVGEKNLANDKVEVKKRKDPKENSELVALSHVMIKIKAILKEI